MDFYCLPLASPRITHRDLPSVFFRDFLLAITFTPRFLRKRLDGTSIFFYKKSISGPLEPGTWLKFEKNWKIWHQKTWTWRVATTWPYRMIKSIWKWIQDMYLAPCKKAMRLEVYFFLESLSEVGIFWMIVQPRWTFAEIHTRDYFWTHGGELQTFITQRVYQW